MNTKCDLHTHSIFSDGSFSPEEIIAEAKRQDLVVALTDHNTVSGLPAFMEAAKAQGVTAVPGVELSTVCEEHELHLVGLFITPEHYKAVEGLCREFHALKEVSNMEMVERLNEAGYMINYLSVKRRNPTGNANRAHIAAELMEQGYVQSVAEAFKTLLAEDKGFYVPPDRLKTVDAIGFLRKIGAVPVWAHPLQELDGAAVRRLLPSLVAAGLVGMETQHSSYDLPTVALAEEIAGEFDLLPSGGSDFHGANKPGILLGEGKGKLNVPNQVYMDLLQYHRSLRREG